jgi:hypothetical protein
MKLAALVLCAAAAMPSFAQSTPSTQGFEASPSRGWLTLPASIIAGPDSAWPFALGFLGLVVLRRTRSGPMF